MGQFDDFLPMTICRNSWVGHLFRVPCGMSLRLCAKNLTNDEEEHESRSHLTCKVENDPRPLRPKIYSFDGGVGGQLRAMSAAKIPDTIALILWVPA